MRYRVRFRRRAKDELQRAKQYSTHFSEELDEWLDDIAASIARGDSSKSINLLELLEEGSNVVGNPSPWKSAWRRWWKAALIEKGRPCSRF